MFREGLAGELGPGAGFPDASLLFEDLDDGFDGVVVLTVRVGGEFESI